MITLVEGLISLYLCWIVFTIIIIVIIVILGYFICYTDSLSRVLSAQMKELEIIIYVQEVDKNWT